MSQLAQDRAAYDGILDVKERALSEQIHRKVQTYVDADGRVWIITALADNQGPFYVQWRSRRQGSLRTMRKGVLQEGHVRDLDDALETVRWIIDAGLAR
jgi:hypothetical protein